jgi:hypothetical protein
MQNIRRLKSIYSVNLSEPWKTLNNVILNDQFKVLPAVESMMLETFIIPYNESQKRKLDGVTGAYLLLFTALFL